MNFRHLRAFAAIVDAGGFARAAERLHVSQPALSRQIHALELELGISLFDRVGRGVRLTSQGEDLLTHSRRLLTELGSLSERARALKAGQAGLLRVGATPQVIESLLADFLAGYERRHPLVEVELKEAGGAQLGDLLDRGEIEVAIMPAGDARFEGRALYPMCLLAVLPEGHRLSRRRSLEVADLEESTAIAAQPGFCFARMVRGCLSNRACTAAGDPRERGPPSDHCSGEDRARTCRCSLAGTNTSRWRPDRTSRTPWRFDRQMDRCRLEPTPIFRSLRRILRRRTCRLCPSRLPGAKFCAPRATIAGAEGVKMLTRGFSCSQRRARDGRCIATMPPAARLVWVKTYRSPGHESMSLVPQITA